MDNYKVRTFLNITFLILAVVSVILYFTVDFKTFLYVCLAAIAIKLLEIFIRFTNP